MSIPAPAASRTSSPPLTRPASANRPGACTSAAVLRVSSTRAGRPETINGGPTAGGPSTTTPIGYVPPDNATERRMRDIAERWNRWRLDDQPRPTNKEVDAYTSHRFIGRSSTRWPETPP